MFMENPKSLQLCVITSINRMT